MAQDIRTRLILDNSDFQKNINESQRSTKTLGNSFSSVVKVVKNLSAAVLGLSVGITALSKRTADYGARLRDLSSNIGVSTKFIQEFRFAATQSGIAVETADRSLESFSRRLGDAATGSGTAARTFAQLGVQLRDASGRLRTSESVMGDVADRLRNIPDATERARVAFELFGRSGIDLVSVLSNGSAGLRAMRDEAQRLGTVMSDQDVRLLGEVSDSYTSLGASIKAVVDQFVVGLSNALLITNEQMTNLIANNNDLAKSMGQGVGEAIKTLGSGIAVLAQNIDIIRNAILTFIGVKLVGNLQTLIARFASATSNAKGLSGMMSGIATATRTALVALAPFAAKLALIVGVTTAITVGLRKFGDSLITVGDTTATIGEIISAIFFKAQQTILDFVSNTAEWFRELPSRLSAPFVKYNDMIQTVFSTAVSVVKQFVNSVIGLHVALIKTLIELIMQLPSGFKAAFDTVINVVRAAGTAIFDILKSSLTLDMSGVKDAYVKFGQTAAQAVSEGVGSKVSEVSKNIAAIFKESMDADFIGAGFDLVKNVIEGSKEILGKWVVEMREAKSSTQSLKKEVTELNNEVDKIDLANNASMTQWDIFAQGWRQAFNDWKVQVTDLTQIGAEMFKKFSTGLSDTLTDFFMTGKANFSGFLKDILRMIVQSQIQRALAGMFSAVGGGNSKGILGSLFGGAFADGGRPPVGKASLVGERGPELFVPNSAGTIIPNDALSTASPGPTVNNYITNNISALDSRSVAQMFAENRQALLGTVQFAQKELPF